MYQFISKTLIFPKKGILVIGDLHLGYDYQIQQSGVLVPENQIKNLIKELKKIFQQAKNKNIKLKKLIFLGDIKHSFGFEYQEKNYFKEVFNFLLQHFEDKNIILIKGNHDTIDYSFRNKMKNYYSLANILFIHGHKQPPKKAFEKADTIVMGHIHPSVIISDKQNIKREKYKCFLTGKYKNKNAIILPSFLSTIEGANVNEYKEGGYEDYFSIIPKKSLLNFTIHAVGKNKVYDFGKVKNI